MKYYAFISYNQHDEKWAKWLHKSIEKYRIPSRLKVNIRRLFPIFLDREELPAAPNLNNKIKEALDQSQFLIVICSPHCVNSNWVNNEISEFIRLGRRDRILCVIVEGEPYVEADKPVLSMSAECIPHALRFNYGDREKIAEIMPLAADLRPGKDGQTRALLKLIAAMIDVNFDDLNRRDLKRRNQQKGIAASILLLLSAAGFAYWLNFVRETTSYYVSAYRQWGEYVGIAPVSEDQIKNRDATLSFHRKGWRGKLDRIDKINSEKKLTSALQPSLMSYLPKVHPDILNNQIARIEYRRDNKGRLMEEVGFNAQGDTIYTLDYIKPKLPPMERSRASFNTEKGRDSRTESGAAVVEYLFHTEGENQGLEYAVNYFDVWGENPKSDNQGIYGQRLEYSKGSKIPSKIQFIGKDNKPEIPKGTGFNTIKLKSNELGLLTVIEMVDESPLSEHPETHENVVYTDYDEVGNIRQMVAKLKASGISSESKMILQKGIMRETISTLFNEYKSVTRSFFDARMQIGMTKEGISSIAVTYEPDKNIPQVTIMRLVQDFEGKTENLSVSGINVPRLEVVPCIVIDEVIAGGVAEDVGMKVGDRILRYGGKETSDTNKLIQLTKSAGWPEKIDVIIVRQTEIMTFRIPPGPLGVRISNN